MRLKRASCIVAYLAKSFARREHRKTCLKGDTYSLHPIPISFSFIFHTNSTAANNTHPMKLFWQRADIEEVSLCLPVKLASLLKVCLWISFVSFTVTYTASTSVGGQRWWKLEVNNPQNWAQQLNLGGCGGWWKPDEVDNPWNWVQWLDFVGCQGWWKLEINNPQNRAWCSVWGGFRPSWASTTLDNPQNRTWCSVWGVFDFPGLQPPSTTLNNPWNRARCSVLGVFDLPGLRAPLTTPEIERDAWFGGLSTFLGFDNPRQPPKLSAMLSLGGFRPPWASTSLHDPRQPLKSSTMLGFGGFRPHYCIIDCRYAPAIYYFLCLLFCAISDESHLNNQNSVLFCTTLDQLHSTLYCTMPDL